MNCESIEVESNALNKASKVNMTGLASLESIDIGNASCGSLTEVIVGSTVFSLLSNVTIGSNSLNSITSLPSSLTSSITSLDIGSDSLLALTTFSLTSLHSLSIGSNSLVSVTELELDESSELESASVGEGSLSGVESLVLGNSTSQSRRLADWRWRKQGMKPFGLHPNDHGYSFSMNKKSVLRNVKKIEVRENCFHTISRFELVKLHRLETIVIGPNSIIGDVSIESYFIIRDCPKLTILHIGDGSFVDYKEIQLHNLTLLYSLYIGTHAFKYVPSFSLIGIVDFPH